MPPADPQAQSFEIAGNPETDASGNLNADALYRQARERKHEHMA